MFWLIYEVNADMFVLNREQPYKMECVNPDIQL